MFQPGEAVNPHEAPDPQGDVLRDRCVTAPVRPSTRARSSPRRVLLPPRGVLSWCHRRQTSPIVALVLLQSPGTPCCAGSCCSPMRRWLKCTACLAALGPVFAHVCLCTWCLQELFTCAESTPQRPCQEEARSHGLLGWEMASSAAGPRGLLHRTPFARSAWDGLAQPALVLWSEKQR